MRGHNELVKQGNLEYIENLKSKLIKISLENESYKGNNMILRSYVYNNFFRTTFR